MFVEFAIALPLLILLMYGLATVGVKIFELGKTQLADYVLEEEVHDVLSRLIYDARAAKSVNLQHGVLTFTYRTINERYTSGGGRVEGDVITVKSESRVYKLVGTIGEKGSKIDYKREIYGGSNPITGDNYFGETRVTKFEFGKLKDYENVLRVTLELKSELSQHKIKISTAIYMPACESFN